VNCLGNSLAITCCAEAGFATNRTDVNNRSRYSKRIGCSLYLSIKCKAIQSTFHSQKFLPTLPNNTNKLTQKKRPNKLGLNVAGDQAISNFLEGYELVVDLWKYMNRRDD
jgi:hypothetical protein